MIIIYFDNNKFSIKKTQPFSVNTLIIIQRLYYLKHMNESMSHDLMYYLSIQMGRKSMYLYHSVQIINNILPLINLWSKVNCNSANDSSRATDRKLQSY